MREELKKIMFKNKKRASIMTFKEELEAEITDMKIDDDLKEYLFKVGVESYSKAWEDMVGVEE